MSKSRVHWRAKRIEGMGPLALCGWFGGGEDRYTTDEVGVTCRRCRKQTTGLVVEEKVEATGIRHGRGCYIPAQIREHVESDHHTTWPTWRMAVRAYVQQMDDGFPGKSSSDPRRFEALPQSGSMTFDGDKGQRTVDKFYAVARAIGNAYPAPFVVQHTPRIEARPSLCAEVLERFVVGKPVAWRVASATGETRKQEYVRRIPQEAAQIATDLLASCKGTAGVVHEIVKQGGLRIEAELERNGWVTQRDDALHRVEESDDMGKGEKGRRLRGMKEIAEYIERSEKTTQRAREWEPPLPVTSVGGAVEAWTAELDEWLASKPRANKVSA